MKKGDLVCNSNCAVAGVVIPISALQTKFDRVEDVEIFSEHAVSGAGYPAAPSRDIFEIVVPT